MSTIETDPREERDDLGMMRRADLWPVWPALPVKKPGWKVGFMVEDGDSLVARPTVYDYRTKKPIAEYASLEDVLADGWVVD